MSSDTFHIISTIRYDPALLSSDENSLPAMNFVVPSPIYMLVYHRDRLMEAAQHFDFHKVAEKLKDGTALHEAILSSVERWREGEGQKINKDSALKLRVLFDDTGKMTVECSATAPLPISSLFPSSLDPPPKSDTQDTAESFKPSPLTGGALTLGPTDYLPPGKGAAPFWKLRLDTAPTPSNPFTLLKTTRRDLYNTSRSRALPINNTAPACVEVIMYNECNELMEGSITSLYFYRGGRWVTPPVGVPAGQFTAATLRDGAEGDRWDEGELRKPFAGRWGHSVRSAKVGAGGQRGTTRRWALAKGMCMEEPVSVDTLQVGEWIWVSNALIGFGYGKVVG